MSYYGLYPSRLACDVLEEMRTCYKTLNFLAMKGLIEELQILCNRMEAGLERKKDINDAEDHVRKLKKEIKDLEKRKENEKDSSIN